ncbi:unnamed protein product, partial [Musa acuminata subsp. burmannicoides]
GTRYQETSNKSGCTTFGSDNNNMNKQKLSKGNSRLRTHFSASFFMKIFSTLHIKFTRRQVT